MNSSVTRRGAPEFNRLHIDPLKVAERNNQRTNALRKSGLIINAGGTDACVVSVLRWKLMVRAGLQTASARRKSLEKSRKIKQSTFAAKSGCEC